MCQPAKPVWLTVSQRLRLLRRQAMGTAQRQTLQVQSTTCCLFSSLLLCAVLDHALLHCLLHCLTSSPLLCPHTAPEISLLFCPDLPLIRVCFASPCSALPVLASQYWSVFQGLLWHAYQSKALLSHNVPACTAQCFVIFWSCWLQCLLAEH